MGEARASANAMKSVGEYLKALSEKITALLGDLPQGRGENASKPRLIRCCIA
jgi:hypothetical protein